MDLAQARSCCVAHAPPVRLERVLGPRRLVRPAAMLLQVERRAAHVLWRVHAVEHVAVRVLALGRDAQAPRAEARRAAGAPASTRTRPMRRAQRLWERQARAGCRAAGATRVVSVRGQRAHERLKQSAKSSSMWSAAAQRPLGQRSVSESTTRRLATSIRSSRHRGDTRPSQRPPSEASGAAVPDADDGSHGSHGSHDAHTRAPSFDGGKGGGGGAMSTAAPLCATAPPAGMSTPSRLCAITGGASSATTAASMAATSAASSAERLSTGGALP